MRQERRGDRATLARGIAGAHRLGGPVAAPGSRRGRVCSRPRDSGGVHRHRRPWRVASVVCRCRHRGGLHLERPGQMGGDQGAPLRSLRRAGVLDDQRHGRCPEAGTGDLRGVSGYRSRAHALRVCRRSSGERSCGGALWDARCAIRAAFDCAVAAVYRRRQPFSSDRPTERDDPVT